MRNFAKIFSLIVLFFGFGFITNAETPNLGIRPNGVNSQTKPIAQEMNRNTKANPGIEKPMAKIVNRPMVMGIVTAIEGNKITIESNLVNPKEKEENKKISFTVETASAIFYESKQEVSLSSVEKGDKIMVEGEVNENNIIATRVHIGDFSAWKNPNIGIENATGEPLVVAKVKEVDQDAKTITVTNKKKETYTVKLEDAKVVKNGEDSELNKISKNDVVLVQGSMDESIVDASIVSVQSKNGNGERVQILKRVGDFFSKLFRSRK